MPAGLVDRGDRLLIPFPGDFTDHTIDIVVAPVPDRPADVFMVPTGGIEMVVFESITLAALPLVLDPG